MEVKVTLKPGQNGTKRLVEHYGDQLVCVRYRYFSRKKLHKIQGIPLSCYNLQPLPHCRTG